MKNQCEHCRFWKPCGEDWIRRPGKWGACESPDVESHVGSEDPFYGADYTRGDFGCIFWEPRQ